MNRLTIRRFDIIRTANVVALLYALLFAVFGLIFLLPFALFGIAGSSQGGNTAGLAAAGLVGGLVIYVLIVAVYAFIGWVTTLILCAFYNFVAGRIGGIRIEVQVESPAGGSPGYPVAGYPASGYPAPAPGAYPTPYGAPAPGPGWPGGAPPAPPA